MGVCKHLLLCILLSVAATTAIAEDEDLVLASNAGNGNSAGNSKNFNNGAAPGNSDFGRGHVGGAAALARLGKELPAVAQRHGMSAEKLSKTLESDPDLLVDTNLDLLYSCSLLGTSSEDGTTAHHHHHHHHRKLAEVDAAVPDPAIATLASSSTGVPLLHSRTGSNFKIYLDFDGHTATGTTWNSNNDSTWACSSAGTCGTIVSPAFDYDNLPLPFSDIEKSMIVSISR